MSVLDNIRARRRGERCDAHKDCLRSDVARLLAALDAVTALVDGWNDIAGPGTRRENVFGEQVISVKHITEEFHDAITKALEAGK